MEAFVAGTVSVDSPPLSLRSLGRWLADQCRPLLPATCSPERIGVYLASRDAGVGPSLEFWREVATQGPSLANPAAFPWTLASSSASHIALDLHLQGPNLTIVGQGEAAFAVLQHALRDLGSGRIDHALAGALDSLDPLRLVVLRLSSQPAGPLLRWTAGPVGPAAAVPHQSPLPIFSALAAAVSGDAPLKLSDPLEGTLHLRGS